MTVPISPRSLLRLRSRFHHLAEAREPLCRREPDADEHAPEAASPLFAEPPFTRGDSCDPTSTLAERWRAGLEAFNRGELPPADPDAADGWYWAENSAFVRRPRG